jgi:8-oxo-dGTP pyrophosphatase MutT (NUDIX family)
MRWAPVLAAASAAEQPGQAAARVPFHVAGVQVGSVDRAHLPALRGWAQWLHVGAAVVTLTAAPGEREAALAAVHAALRTQGLIRAWRDEPFPLFDPHTHAVLATMERAASRFWGSLTLGAHANGYVADAQGRPTHLWIAQRAFDKATDPGLYDNLIGGGVPAGQTPLQALQREGWEEAGLNAAQMTGVQAIAVLRLHRDVPEGRQFEDLHAYDLALPPGLQPQNQDGEVAGFHRLPVDEALALAAGTSPLGRMTLDAALVTLAFGHRHGLLPAAEHAALDAAGFMRAV